MPQIPLHHLEAHPDNANIMPASLLKKLAAHLRMAGNDYPPLIVRPHPLHRDRYQILDGHHRARALKQIGRTDAKCEVWEADDQRAALLLLTLNRLQGQDDPKRRGALLEQLANQIGIEALSTLVPDDSERMQKLMELNRLPAPLAGSGELAPACLHADWPQAVTFFLNEVQRRRLFDRLAGIDGDRSSALIQLLELDSPPHCDPTPSPHPTHAHHNDRQPPEVA